MCLRVLEPCLPSLRDLRVRSRLARRRAVVELDGPPRLAFRMLPGRFDETVVGREGARGIRRRGVAGEVEGLAAAAAVVDRATVAAPARLGHPLLAPVPVEAGRITPDLLEGVRAHALESDSAG